MTGTRTITDVAFQRERNSLGIVEYEYASKTALVCNAMPRQIQYFDSPSESTIVRYIMAIDTVVRERTNGSTRHVRRWRGRSVRKKPTRLRLDILTNDAPRRLWLIPKTQWRVATVKAELARRFTTCERTAVSKFL
jgi:hypothetical protein